MNNQHKKVIVPAVYRSNKTGNCYHTMQHVLNQTNKDEGDVMIIYHNHSDYCYVREVEEFLSKFTFVSE